MKYLVTSKYERFFGVGFHKRLWKGPMRLEGAVLLFEPCLLRSFLDKLKAITIDKQFKDL